ncbi:MAG: transaldolase [Dehalococcoidia bacterium]|nr:transaldolase [Dehalococcoidia bacterium]
MDPLKAVQQHGQSIWLDYIRRELITSGRLAGLLDEGLRGLTSNPTIFHKAVAESTDYDAQVREIVQSNPDARAAAIYERLAIEDIRKAADIFRQVYEESYGADGYVSLEPSAHLAYDTQATIAEVRRLWQLVDRPNVMIKVPATRQGVPAIETLIAQEINVNVTLMFSLKHYNLVSRAWLRGIERCDNPQRVASVASFFVSRIDTYVDRELERIGGGEALALRGRAAVANSRLAYRRFRQILGGEEFSSLGKRGARIQRLLWGSTSTKNPAYSDVKYVEELIGPDTVNTVPLETLEAFREHGRVEPGLPGDIEEAEEVINGLESLGIRMDSVCEQLQVDGVRAFADSLDALLASLEQKRRQFVPARR